MFSFSSPKTLDPFGEREAGGDDRGAPLVAVGEQVEEQLAAGPLEGDEAEFIDDQHGDAQIALMRAGERVFVARLDQFADEGDQLAALNGLETTVRNRKVCAETTRFAWFHLIETAEHEAA
ncbi:MAG: hypothetical protein OXD50_07640 [Chloroflexi bacterium]|nr:hypothetical protein [Chloroflexota bacterium]